ncbi:MAG: hypothetical protein HYU41_05970 [Candidatus Rokubacteria bacterium]|nr:hypothetical protein [Candidatus Rokubacteria bacterium]
MKFLNTTLKGEVFKIIFDGFDEYILWNRGAVQPLEVLDALSQLVATTGARIIITSRTSFWNTNLPGEETRAFLERTHSALYKLLPFDEQHARNYFAKRFTDQAKADQAIAVTAQLRHAEHDLVGRGFVLSLIADLVDRSDGRRPVVSGTTHAVDWLMRALCDRETLRQRLPLNGDDQMRVLQLFAVEVARGAAPTTDMLTLALQEVVPRLESHELEDCITKFHSHPLLTKDLATDSWQWQQEQLEIALLADHLVTLAVSANPSEPDFVNFLTNADLSGSRGTDIASMVVEIVRTRPGAPEDELRRIIGAILAATVASQDTLKRLNGRRLAVGTASVAVDRLLPPGAQRRARSELLVKLCQGSPIVQLPFSGTVARMELRGVTFSLCRFERVTWANCLFDETTIFEDCHFLGGSSIQSEGFGLVTFKRGRFDQEATAWIGAAQVQEGKKKYSADDLKNDISLVINKFLVRGGLGVKTLEETNLKKGPIRDSRYRNEILDKLCSSVLGEHEISGRSDKGFHVRPTAIDAVIFYGTNNVFTGAILVAFERLKDRLRLT